MSNANDLRSFLGLVTSVRKVVCLVALPLKLEELHAVTLCDTYNIKIYQE